MSEEQDNREIRIRGSKPDSSDLAQYLLKAFLLLRDRDNTEQYVTVNGIGSAIPSALLVAEIIRKKLNVSLITSLETITQQKTRVVKGEQGERKESTFQQDLTKIKLKLTFVPTEDEKKSIGYQEPLQIEKDQFSNVDLFDYVMLYVKDLYELKRKGRLRRTQQQQRQNRQPYQSDRGERRGAQRQKEGDREGDRDRREDQERNNTRDRQIRYRSDRIRQEEREDEFDRKDRRQYRREDRRDDRRDDRKDDREEKEGQERKEDRGEIKTRGGAKSRYQEKRTPDQGNEINQEKIRDGNVVKRGGRKQEN